MNDDTTTVVEAKKFDPKEYMRQYRAAGKDQAAKVQTKARAKALTWLRATHPDKWDEFLAQAREEVKMG